MFHTALPVLLVFQFQVVFDERPSVFVASAVLVNVQPLPLASILKVVPTMWSVVASTPAVSV